MGTNGNPQAPYIEFKNVSKSFGDNHVLDNVNFNVMPKETVCILGRSGVGKSVALHHIMGFLKPDSGRVIVAFEDITDIRKKNWSVSARKSPWFFKMERCSIRSPSARTWPSRCASVVSFPRIKCSRLWMA